MSLRALSKGELGRMRLTQNSAMLDTCVLMIYAEASRDEYNKPTYAYTDGKTVPCGLSFRTTERMGQAQVAAGDAVLRLPIGTEITRLDRLKVTKRHGEPITPITFDIIGEPQRGPSGLVLTLLKVTDGSG